MGLILLIVLIVLLMGGLPRWDHSRNWGYGPSGGMGLLLVICLFYWSRGSFLVVSERPVLWHDTGGLLCSI